MVDGLENFEVPFQRGANSLARMRNLILFTMPSTMCAAKRQKLVSGFCKGLGTLAVAQINDVLMMTEAMMRGITYLFIKTNSCLL